MSPTKLRVIIRKGRQRVQTGRDTPRKDEAIYLKQCQDPKIAATEVHRSFTVIAS
jgi:hypothetical protein